MSRDFLSQVIRSYGGTTRAVVGSYLEQSLRQFVEPERTRPAGLTASSLRFA